MRIKLYIFWNEYIINLYTINYLWIISLMIVFPISECFIQQLRENLHFFAHIWFISFDKYFRWLFLVTASFHLIIGLISLSCAQHAYRCFCLKSFSHFCHIIILILMLKLNFKCFIKSAKFEFMIFYIFCSYFN